MAAASTMPAKVAVRLEWDFICSTFRWFLTRRPVPGAWERPAPERPEGLERRNVDEAHVRTLVEITEPTSSRPMMMLVTLTVTPSSRSALEMTPMRTTPASTPCSRPRPPKMETPPSSTAAIT